MSKYAVRLDKPVQKVLDGLPRALYSRLMKAIVALADDPRPSGSLKMESAEALYRIRVGDWRIIYSIEDDVLVVVVVRIGQRKDVYRHR
jgi:mRNA interferase RelE/StbE